MKWLLVYKLLHQFTIVDLFFWLFHLTFVAVWLKCIYVYKYIFLFSCVCRWLPHWTTWPFFMANEGSTRKQSLCVKGHWRSEKRWVRSCLWLYNNFSLYSQSLLQSITYILSSAHLRSFSLYVSSLSLKD